MTKVRQKKVCDYETRHDLQNAFYIDQTFLKKVKNKKQVEFKYTAHFLHTKDFMFTYVIQRKGHQIL